jgi:hypothetical protein
VNEERYTSLLSAPTKTGCSKQEEFAKPKLRMNWQREISKAMRLLAVCLGHGCGDNVHLRLSRESLGGKLLRKFWTIDENRFSANFEDTASAKSVDVLARLVSPASITAMFPIFEFPLKILTNISI